MGVFDNLPYTNFHELNVNWLIREVKNLKEEVEQLKARVEQLENEDNN